MLCLLLTCAHNAFSNEKPTAPPSIPGAVTVTAEEVIKLILSNPEIVLIDSRKRTEYIKGHIEGAINLLNTGLSIDDLELAATDKTSAIVFYCNGPRCLRSSDSVKKAIAWGYSNIFWFRGGWKEWVDKKFPIMMGEYLYPSK